MRGWLKRLLSAEDDGAELARHVNRAAALIDAGRPKEGAQACRDALAIDPHSVHALCNLSIALLALGDEDGAQRSAGQAAALDPKFLPAQTQLGDVLLARGSAAHAAERYREAVRLAPGSALALNSLGYALQVLGDLDQALRCYEQALSLDPRYVQAHLNRAAVWLLQGHHARGWEEYEWRLRDPRHAIALGQFAASRWDGSPLAGRSLLVHAEQGLGDQIMYASCLTQVLAGAGRCTVCCEPRLVSLLQRSFPGAKVTATPPHGERFDLAIEMASLPRLLRRDAGSLAGHEGYLRADPDRVQAWRDRLAQLGRGAKIGISWRGGVRQTGTAWRSLPLAALRPFLALPGLQFVSLQYGPCAEEIDVLRRDHGIQVHHWREAIDDYEETAALVCALDLVIAVCTAAVHLRGALGRPVWVMAPVVPEPRYGLSGPHMPWYGSARMFRQRTHGEWEPVIRDIVAALRDKP